MEGNNEISFSRLQRHSLQGIPGRAARSAHAFFHALPADCGDDRLRLCAVTVGGMHRPSRTSRRGASADSLQPRNAQPEFFRAGRHWHRAANCHHFRHRHVARARTRTRDARAINGKPAFPLGTYARQTHALPLHRHADGGGIIFRHAMAIPRPDCRRFWRADVGDLPLCVCPVESRSAHFDARAKPDSSAANDHDLYPAIGVLFRIHFSARDDALDFLCDRFRVASHLLHRIGARHCAARCKSGGFLGKHRGAGRHGPGPVQFLRPAVQAENCVILPGKLSTKQIRSKNTSARLRLRVTAAAESILRSGHPWLFSDSVQDQNRPGVMGELAVVYDRKDRFLAMGLFDPDSPIRVRLLHVGKPETIDQAWWLKRLDRALKRRRGLFDEQTTGFRWINGESDGWPGLILDRYDTTLVLKLYTAAWLPRLEEIVGIIKERLGPERIVLRLSRNIQKSAGRHFAKTDGEVLSGSPPAGPLIFLESGLRFEADVMRGQKTGFFLDQRENRRTVQTLARGRNVLNAFSFSGGFSLYAARGGARSVTDLDISPHALDAARRNFTLNHGDPAVVQRRHETIQADAFLWLERNLVRKFDLIILDPPSLA